ncbi:MAG: Dipeptide epimerase [Candidatus Thermoplasmatota archaeon]|nr:Dipeptide epimerase [Candidatus Thermoplasmatota archaeon]
MIESVLTRTFINQRKYGFRIATGSADVAENIAVKIVSGDESGVGCASPSDVTHETVRTVEEFLAKVPKKIVGTDEADLSGLHRRLDAIAPGNTSAKAAVDIAAYDLLSKRAGKPLREFLGGARGDSVLTDMTIGIESKDVTVKRALKHYKEGFRALKIKVGLDLEDDVRRVAAVRDAVGPKVQLRVDANQGYSVEQAVTFCEAMRTLDVAVVEQPVKAEDYAGLKRVKERSAVPIMADECVKDVADARRVIRDEVVDLINIKLMKSSGIHDAITINRLAAEAGIGTMVGCMGEIQLSIAAGLHFVLSSENVRFADLDSHFNIVGDPSSGLEFIDGTLRAPKTPGLGITDPFVDQDP